MSRRKPGAGDYEVGYGRPPLATRFQPGRSGNPRGRPKAQRTIDDDLRDALNAKVKVVENGRSRTYTAQQVIFRNLVFEAARKNFKAVSALVSLRARYASSPETVLDPVELPDADRFIVQAFIDRVRGAGVEAGRPSADDRTAPGGSDIPEGDRHG